MPIDFTQISSAQLASLPREKTVFFFSVGPVEDHGPHLPLSLDLQEASYLSQLSAEKLEEQKPGWVGVVMPGVLLGIDSNTTRAALRVRPHVLRDWLVDSCLSLVHQGFTQFVCFSGHLGPRQITAIEDAADIIRKQGRWIQWTTARHVLGTPKPTLISASSALVAPAEVWKSPLWPDPKEHGGKRDTSVALAINAATVGSMYSALPGLDPSPTFWDRAFHRFRHRTQGYWGEPSQASAQFGAEVLKDTVDQVFPKMRAVWEGSNPRSLFKSWYCVFPSNKSFFKAWVLVLLIMALTAVWIAMAISSVQI